jgi:23S rRNA pseudouridine2604 synthase
MLDLTSIAWAGNVDRVRINKFFTEQGLCSRRAADRLIEEGRVLINGRRAVLGDHVGDEDVVTLDGSRVMRHGDTVYLAYHKPVGVTCTTDLDVPGNIIKAVGYPTRIFPIGRLDKDSSGLILLTNDGDIVNRILRVEFGHEREYVVTVDRPYPESLLQLLAEGVVVLGKRTHPCRTSRVNHKSFRIILTEGRNRQIRRMCSALGFRVVQLIRVRIMHVRLGTLRAGHWRSLSDKERLTLLETVQAAGDRQRLSGSGVHRRTA